MVNEPTFKAPCLAERIDIGARSIPSSSTRSVGGKGFQSRRQSQRTGLEGKVSKLTASIEAAAFVDTSYAKP